jgi:hypothetical protein
MRNTTKNRNNRMRLQKNSKRLALIAKQAKKAARAAAKPASAPPAAPEQRHG